MHKLYLNVCNKSRIFHYNFAILVILHEPMVPLMAVALTLLYSVHHIVS
jgi:hypothetical protein